MRIRGRVLGSVSVITSGGNDLSFLFYGECQQHIPVAYHGSHELLALFISLRWEFVEWDVHGKDNLKGPLH